MDLVGVGVGPANLSLAALAEPLPELRTRFLDAKPGFQWHPGFMLPGAELQVSFLKDLVTLVDPTSRYSFLNFLAAHKRIYRFLVASRSGCSRQEYEQYCRWVSESLTSVSWNSAVEEVDLANDRTFTVRCADGRRLRARALVLGSGRTPVMPECAERLRGPSVLHNAELAFVDPEFAGRDVVVVGGGQSGAETVQHLLSAEAGLPRSITWLSSRLGFPPMDDSPFTNDWFTPAYVEYFRQLPSDRRRRLLAQQRMASDGVSASLLQAIYRRLYELDVQRPGRLRHRLLDQRRLVDLAKDGNRLSATIHDTGLDAIECVPADVVICCTGYRPEFPEYLGPLRSWLPRTAEGFEVQDDYSLAWDGPEGLRIFVQNAAEHTHGIADPNLSLVPWRSARILNSVLGYERYPTSQYAATVEWEGPGAHAGAHAPDFRLEEVGKV
ncbi:lysine N(6)-hydroxylase/L-ornithine N(5)-oxygenase family protein [Kitasatospora sp. SUK 42]|uniref:lysine N(6)-hydroxylase/L-ornithine N(5)-oxygenase family protein n=1 Tax=Kitasatospora sp. SUK 42 TaxID=1588882 RepID=UPI0020C8B736|nr:SidA/IucD/PvdA family monooxygenase [Kitasatospora sp. SUK 42]